MAQTRNVSPRRPTAAGRPVRAQNNRTFGPTRSPLANVPTKYHTPIFIGLILFALLVFFGGVIFSGKLFVSGDFLSWESFQPYLSMMDKKGEAPLWIPYIFSGMPGYAALLVTGDRWWDLTMKIIYSAEHVFGFIDYPVMRVVMHYFIYGLGMYLLMRSKKAARSTAFFVGVAAIFSTWIIIYVMIGHNTKIMVLMTFPYIFMCLERLINRWSLLYAALLVLAVHVMWEASHLQTAFYGACAIGIYLLFELVAALVAKERGISVTGVIRAAVVMVVAAGFTYGMGMDRTLAVREYVPFSTRGAPAMVSDTTQSGHEKEAADLYDYNTNWSFSPEEMVTFLVPSYYGWGKLQYSGPETNGQAQAVPTYWGQMPFTDAGHYMGISVLILGLFGAWTYRRERFVQALVVISFLGLLLSFGKNFSVLFNLFYSVVPGFDKFRAPSQATVLLEFAFPILAGFGIESLLAMKRAGDNPKADRSMLYAVIAGAVFFFIGLAGTSALKASYIQSVNASHNSEALQSPAIQDFIFNTMRLDWIFSGFFALATLLLMYYYMKGRLTPTVLKLSLLVILIADLWRVDYRPMDAQPASVAAQEHASTDVDAFLDKDKSLYRILDITEQPNYPAYQFHQNVMGYHAAKMRNYQNFLDFTDGSQQTPRAGGGNLPTSQLAWNILGTKYIIADKPIAEGLTPVFTSQQKKAVVFENPGALPRAWFVNRTEVLGDRTILERMRDNGFDPQDVAYLHQPLAAQVEPVGYVAAVAPDTMHRTSDTSKPAPKAGGTPAGGSIKFTNYEPLHIAMDVDAPGNNFMVISEVHYPPGWKATIDGKPADIIQTDYLLRGLVIPKGHHAVKMDYVSSGFEMGKWMSLALNLVMFAAIIVGGMMERKRPADPIEQDERHEAEVIEEDDV